MENLDLTPRLATIAALVPQNARLADIGTDHGHLPLWLMRQNRLQSAIASDIRPAPLAHAQQNATAYGLHDKIEFCLAAGLEGITACQCDVISIAGMGGETIAGILEQAPWTKTGMHTLLLQPMTMVPELRQWLWAHGYTITREVPCVEGKRMYVILSAQGGAQPVDKPIGQCRYSPALLQEVGAVDYLQYLLAREKRIVGGLFAADTQDCARIAEHEQAIVHLKAGLEELLCQL